MPSALRLAAAILLLMVPQVAATKEPTGAKPAGNPGAWVTSDDYPKTALRGLQEGRSGFRLAIDKHGGVASCTIVSTSGSPVLDQTACSLLTARARFIPAQDKSGTAIPSTYRSAVVWRLPPDAALRALLTDCVLGPTSDIRVITPDGCLR